jgi:glucokinase
MRVLAGDIGGTKTLLAICEVSAPSPGTVRVDILEELRYESRKYPGLASICREFAGSVRGDLPRHAGFGVAGPVKNGRSHTTNLPWVLDERDLAATIGIDSVRLANDFQALGLGIAAVKEQDLVTLNEGVRDPRGTWAILGAGTGLGEAIATLGVTGQREVLATEGGHTSFAPRNELEIGILRILLRRWDHVSWERLVCGEGLVNLTEALQEITGLAWPPEVLHVIREDRENAPAKITGCAQQGERLCRMALEVFCSLYGAEAGNLALKTLATGGVFVAGGIAPKILDFLREGRFRESFFAKGRMRVLLEQMPVQVVLDQKVGLLGAAILAARTTPTG